ncbi:uncharacterized protein LOC124140971 [Haliotis rufescens]|uniref:uncharacterized protein LOC124140971 n=1 Tax=Haliotis rufescens TaxID=6454 RepID=UPI00201F8010|nr:uncharacterized protein LOC124140971 [Haliotis rufescens]
MHKQSRRKDDELMSTKMKNCFVKFFVVGKVTGPNRWEVIVGCLEPNEIYLCLDDWKSKSFVTLAVSGQFASQERQSYRFQVKGLLKFPEEYNDHLELLPGETSYQSILVEVSQSIDAAPLGRINIYAEGDQMSRLVTELPLPLTAGMEASLRIEAASHQENNTEQVVSSFFGGVVKEMSLDNSLFEQLGLSDAEMKRIRDDTAATDTEYRMFVMLYQCCERQRDKAAFIRKFLIALANVQQNNAKRCLVESIKRWLAVSTPDEDDGIFAQELSAIVNDFAEQGLITLPGDYRNTTYVETRNCKKKVLRNMKVSLDMTTRVGAPKTFLRLSYSEPEDNPHGQVAKMNEAFWGDLVEWCISTTTIGLTIVFHLQDGPGRYAELVLKYATFGHTQEEALVETLFIPEEQRWEATSQISVGSRGWFVLCTRPKKHG